MDDLMDCLNGARFFTKIYLESGYHEISIHEGDEWKLHLRKKEELFDWFVMPFGLTGIFLEDVTMILDDSDVEFKAM